MIKSPTQSTSKGKVEIFKLATSVVVKVAESIEEKSEQEQREIIDKVILLLREIYPEAASVSSYTRTCVASEDPK